MPRSLSDDETAGSTLADVFSSPLRLPIRKVESDGHTGWDQADVGQINSVKIATEAGSILAIAKVDVPLQPRNLLPDRIGDCAEVAREVRFQPQR